MQGDDLGPDPPPGSSAKGKGRNRDGHIAGSAKSRKSLTRGGQKIGKYCEKIFFVKKNRIFSGKKNNANTSFPA